MTFQSFQVLPDNLEPILRGLESVLALLHFDGLHLGLPGNGLEFVRVAAAAGIFRFEARQFAG